jgi:tight adherence protein C
MSGSVLLFGGLGALGLAIALAVVTLTATHPTGNVTSAIAAIESRYARDASVEAQPRRSSFAAAAWLRSLALRLSPSGYTGKLQRRLDLAGNPAAWTADRFLAVKGLGLLALGTFGVVVGVHSVATLILYAAIGAAAGFFVPDLLLYNAGQKRQEAIRKALPDVLDMLTVCVEAGLGFDAALAQVARTTTGPLAAECARVLQEMQIGKSRTEALRAMADRTTVSELRAFASALVQAGELGIPVARVLREQAKEMRIRRRQRAEEQAQKVTVKILFPLIFFLFPALFVVIIGPGAINIAHTLFSK